MKVSIRAAAHEDLGAIRRLLDHLGYKLSQHTLAANFSSLNSDTDPVLVAVADGEIVGLAALHFAAWLHLEKPIARMTAIVVAQQHARRGIGRRLIDQSTALAKRAGCGSLELTTAVENTQAQAFYRHLGFDQTSVRFKRALD